VIVFASVSMTLPVQKGHVVGRVTASWSGDSDIFFPVLLRSPRRATLRSRVGRLSERTRVRARAAGSNVFIGGNDARDLFVDPLTGPLFDPNAFLEQPWALRAIRSGTVVACDI
jgi:hypothetical protein